MTKPFSWSYSQLTTFEQCRKKHYHLSVAKDVKDEDSDMSREGKLDHEALKARVVDGKPLPIERRHFEKIAARFAALPGEKKGEMKLALNRDFEPVAYFAPDVWVRVVIDLLVVQGNTAILVDWKTGKKKVDPTQNALCAAVLARWMPEIELFKTMYVWLNIPDITPKNYTLSKLPDVWAELTTRVARMEQARKTTDYPATPSGLCRGWCPVKQCPHFEER